MHRRAVVWLVSLTLSTVPPAAAQTRTLAERLGYPADAKLLIIHADDLGVAHAVDSASFAALDARAVTSASVMMPTPWVTEVAEYARSHPDADLGLHLTLTSEWKTYRWGPVAARREVPSLLDSTGMLWNETAPAAAHETAADVERELRAQVERALALGIRPTHLDTHMGVLLARPDFFAAYVKVAHDYKLPFLTGRPAGALASAASLLSDRDVVVDAAVIAGPEVPRDRWKQFYLDAIAQLKPGLTEMIVHLGRDDAELQAITVDHEPYGSAWRQRDYDVMTSPEFQQALRDHHVVLVRWRDLQKLAYQP
jgi:predicted glycoside hydrolase/deacetylase ChbG (UPF0249 family)